VVDDQRIEALRRPVERDPTSIAFAQLAEELRRAGQMQAVEICRAGLITHPGYVSARVTLARALAALDRLDEAQAELERVLRSAPDTLTAVRGLADISYRRGNMPEALMRYRAALSLAPNDPELPQIVARSVSEKREHAPSGARLLLLGRAPTLSGDVSGQRPEPVRSSPLAPQPSPPLRLNAERDRGERTVAALEKFLEAIRSAN
jgi:tetratricopeptide (TPR) repeat protein